MGEITFSFQYVKLRMCSHLLPFLRVQWGYFLIAFFTFIMKALFYELFLRWDLEGTTVNFFQGYTDSIIQTRHDDDAWMTGTIHHMTRVQKKMFPFCDPILFTIVGAGAFLII